jgi:hypothetical protein
MYVDMYVYICTCYIYVHTCNTHVHISYAYKHICTSLQQQMISIMYCMSGVSRLRLSSCTNALNFCVHNLCLRGLVYVFYVGHIDKIM